MMSKIAFVLSAIGVFLCINGLMLDVFTRLESVLTIYELIILVGLNCLVCSLVGVAYKEVVDDE